MTDRLRDLRNLGPVSEADLTAVGIRTPADLDAAGAAAAYVRLLEDGPSRPTRTMLWALAGALLEMDWRELPEEVRRSLLEEVEAARRR